jgi:hypothetical protein
MTNSSYKNSKNHLKILIIAPIPERKFIYYSLISKPAEELPALSEISKYFFHT